MSSVRRAYKETLEPRYEPEIVLAQFFQEQKD